MKLGVSLTSFREKNIVPIIEQYKDVADEIVVAVSKKPWFGDYEADDTAKRVLSTGVAVREYDWRLEADQRNWTMGLLSKCDYVIVSHSDTFFTQEDLKLIKEDLEGKTSRQYTCHTLTYWKDYDTVIDPDLVLPTLIIRSDCKFTNSIIIENQESNPPLLRGTCHHVSWVKSDEEVLKKISTYHHANEINKSWFDGVWKNWHDGMKNFGPTFPGDFKSTRKSSLPLEIRNKLV